MTYDYDRAARDQEANEWSLAIKAEKHEKAVRAGHGTKEEAQALREKDAEEAAAREKKRQWDDAIKAAEERAKREDEQFRIHQEEQRKWLGDDEDIV